MPVYSSTTQILQLNVKKLFCSAADTVGLSVPQEQGMRSTGKKFQQSSEHHKRLAEQDIVHNQAFANSAPPSTPPPPLPLSGVLRRLRLRHLTLLAPLAA